MAAGTYEVDLTSASSTLLQSAFGVSGGGSYAYAFVSPKALAAGSYQATASDFQFPATLSALKFAVAQNHAVLKQASAAGSVSFTSAAAPVVLLADATPTSGSNGLFDVNVQTSAGSVVFDQIQPVSAAGGLTTQPLTLGTSGNYNVTLTDLGFPAQFSTLALVGSSAGSVLGKIYGGGTFPITAAPGDYQFTVVAIPAAQQQYGLYGIEIVNAPPTVKLSASPTSVPAGGCQHADMDDDQRHELYRQRRLLHRQSADRFRQPRGVGDGDHDLQADMHRSRRLGVAIRDGHRDRGADGLLGGRRSDRTELHLGARGARARPAASAHFMATVAAARSDSSVASPAAQRAALAGSA